MGRLQTKGIGGEQILRQKEATENRKTEGKNRDEMQSYVEVYGGKKRPEGNNKDEE